jgi:amino acid permease
VSGFFIIPYSHKNKHRLVSCFIMGFIILTTYMVIGLSKSGFHSTSTVRNKCFQNVFQIVLIDLVKSPFSSDLSEQRCVAATEVGDEFNLEF